MSGTVARRDGSFGLGLGLALVIAVSALVSRDITTLFPTPRDVGAVVRAWLTP